MNAKVTSFAIAAGTATLCASIMNTAFAVADASQVGPDLVVGGIEQTLKHGSVANGGVTTMAYSFGFSPCNVGTSNLSESGSNNQHSAHAQNLYRLRNGRMEQIGLGWAKHTVCALQMSLCGTCQPAGSGCPPLLGVGCSDSTTATASGSSSQLGPRSQVNASTGAFSYPVVGMPAAPAIIGRRVQVDAADLDPAQNAGAQYFVEIVGVNPSDAAVGNNGNNASFRRVTVGPLSEGAYTLVPTGGTTQQQGAIYAWQAADPQVSIVEIPLSGDDIAVVASRATDNGNGTWHYEYAIFNMNSDAAVGSVSVPVAGGVAVSNIGFHDVSYHSGDPYSAQDWNASNSAGAVTWACETFAANANANALRWGTTYNFRFDATTPPTQGTLTMGAFKNANVYGVQVVVPSPAPTAADLNSDGTVDGADLGVLLGQWGRCSECTADFNHDGIVDGADLGVLLGAWNI